MGIEVAFWGIIHSDNSKLYQRHHTHLGEHYFRAQMDLEFLLYT